MPIGAETFVSPALQPVLDLICSEGVKLFVKLSGGELEDTLAMWESELELINGLLDDAMAKQFQSKAVQRWLKDLQDLAFDMEDILADFEIQAQKHEFNMNSADQQDDGDGGVCRRCINAFKKMMMVARTTISDYLSTLYNTISPGVQSKIKGINTRLHRIQSHAQLLHLSMVNNAQQQLNNQTETRQRQTSSLQLESNVYGRAEGKQKIITRLLEDEDDSSNETYVVIPIVGSGGIGKTTLAQWVYNDEKVKSHFGLMAWVCVSDDFDVKRITITIVKEATGTGTGTLDKSSSLNAAQTQLMKNVMGKKFLIVLDDVWNCTNHGWQRLNTPFKHAAKGSRVIMTTRNDRDARTMINCATPDTIIRLKELSEDDCWNLFQQHANNDSDLDEMRDDIVKKCKGLPLAAKALGGLFKKTENKSERQMILKSNIWSEDNIWGEDIDILPVLRLSYDYLPSHLKRAFAYFSLFPKDYKFEKMEVILIWMSQGFLPNDELMEDLGHKYFNDLESRSLLEQSPHPYDGGKFVMHDLIHDLALSAAGGICYARGTKNMTHVDRERIRHVFLTQDEDATSLLSQLKASHLRTFYHDGNITNLDFIQRLSYVRTLRLVSKTIKVLPECIGVLKHLRFLSLNFRSITELPESINCLWNLQTLELKGCWKLKEVPYIGSLKKLRHLEIDLFQVELPQGLEKLINLRSLEYFKLADGNGYRIKKLKNLNHLQGQLRICGLENVSKVEDAAEAQLHQKSGLDELHLEWGNIREGQVDYNTIRDVLEQLKPATSMKGCKLDRYMGLTLPTWLGDPSLNKIVTIKLWRCKKCEELPALGQLPCLKILHIERMNSIKRVGVEFYGCSNPFPALESLIFYDLYCWEKWEHIAVDSNRAFPCLESLQIYDCDSLQGDLPPFTPSLKTLKINNRCKELSVSVSLPGLPLLERLEVDHCKSLSITTEDMMQGGGALLENLRIDVEDIKGVQKWELPHLHSLEIRNFDLGDVETEEDLNLSLSSSSLRTVNIVRIHNLKNLSVVDGTNLNDIFIQNCKKLESLEVANFTYALSTLSLNSCPKLQSLHLPPLFPTHTLDLSDLGSCTDAIEHIPGPNLELPSSLLNLRIGDFQNLKTVSCSSLPNLWCLEIEHCPKFESFGDTALPTQLKEVYIKECELIKPHLQSDPQNGVIWMDGLRDRYTVLRDASSY